MRITTGFFGENVTKASNSVHKAASGVGCIHGPRPIFSSIVRPGQGQVFHFLVTEIE